METSSSTLVTCQSGNEERAYAQKASRLPQIVPHICPACASVIFLFIFAAPSSVALAWPCNAPEMWIGLYARLISSGSNRSPHMKQVSRSNQVHVFYPISALGKLRLNLNFRLGGQKSPPWQHVKCGRKFTFAMLITICIWHMATAYGWRWRWPKWLKHLTKIRAHKIVIAAVSFCHLMACGALIQRTLWSDICVRCGGMH